MKKSILRFFATIPFVVFYIGCSGSPSSVSQSDNADPRLVFRYAFSIFIPAVLAFAGNLVYNMS